MAVLTAPISGAQAPDAAVSTQSRLTQALQLARAHRYADASAAIHGLAPPADQQQRIVFYRLRASIELGLGHPTPAASDMEAAAALAPNNLDLQVASKFARLEAQLDSHASPASTLQWLRNLDLPHDKLLEVRMRSAEMLSAAGLYAEAANDLDAANRLSPGRADILYNLALARYRQGQWDSALASAQEAKSIEDSASLESLLGDIQEKRGDALDAVHSYQSAVTLEPNVEQYHLVLARDLLKHQTFDAAIVVLEQSVNLFPQSVRVKILLGLAYFLVDRSADSTRTLLAAAKMDPNEELPSRYLGEIGLQDSAAPNSDAVTQICSFADSHPSSKTADALCGGVLLRAAEDSGDDARKPEILRRLQHAVRIAPQEPLARCQLGKAFEWSQQWSQARIQLEKCVQLDPDSPEGHYHLARVYRRMDLSSLADKQTTLQQQAAQRQSEESTKRTNTVTRFLVLLDH